MTARHREMIYIHIEQLVYSLNSNLKAFCFQTSYLMISNFFQQFVQNGFI